jgi:hypothetical protein
VEAAAAGLHSLPERVCARAVHHTSRYAGGALSMRATMVDFDGRVLGEAAVSGNTP